MRSALRKLEKSGRLTTVQGAVHPKFELAAVLAQAPGRNAVMFNRVEGYETRVVGNLVDRTNFSVSCGIEPTLEASLQHISRGIEHPVPAALIHDAPCREVVITDKIDIMSIMPVATFF